MMDIIAMVVFVFPLGAFFLGWLAQILLKKLWVAPLLVFLVSLTATYLVFNPTFLFWVGVYTVLALAGSLVGCKRNR